MRAEERVDLDGFVIVGGGHMFLHTTWLANLFHGWPLRVGAVPCACPPKGQPQGAPTSSSSGYRANTNHGHDHGLRFSLPTNSLNSFVGGSGSRNPVTRYFFPSSRFAGALTLSLGISMRIESDGS